MPRASALGGPEEFFGARKPAGKAAAFVEIDPGWVGFAKEFRGTCAGRIGAEEERGLLSAVHDGEGERRVGLPPDHAREVGEFGGIPLEPPGGAPAAGNDAEAYGGVGRASGGVSKFGGGGFGMERIGDVADLDGRLICLLIGDEARVR